MTDRLIGICARPGCTGSYARGQSYRQLPPYCSHACQRLAARVPVPDRTWFCRRLRNCDLAAEGFTTTDLEMLLRRYRRTGYVTPAQVEYVHSPANHVGHRRIRDEQLRLIAEALEQSRPVLRKVV